MQLFQEDWKWKRLPLLSPIPWFSFPFTQSLNPLLLCSSFPNPWKSPLRVLGTETRLPNLSASLLQYELEMNATCLDSINSYYSLLSTGDLPQGCLSLSPCRTAATRDAEEPGLHHPSLSSGCHQLRVSEGWLSSSHQRDTGKCFSPLFFNLIMILLSIVLYQGARSWTKCSGEVHPLFHLAARWFHWMLILLWTVRNSK